MNSTLENLLIGIASNVCYFLIIGIASNILNWELIKRLFTSLMTRSDNIMEEREMQRAPRLDSPTPLSPRQHREETMPSVDPTLDINLEPGNGSVNREVPLSGFAAAVLTDVDDNLDNIDHIVDLETESPLVTANQDELRPSVPNSNQKLTSDPSMQSLTLLPALTLLPFPPNPGIPSRSPVPVPGEVAFPRNILDGAVSHQAIFQTVQ